MLPFTAGVGVKRQNLISFVCGRKGAGKSQLLHEVFSNAHPRVITLDMTYSGEVLERDPNAIPAFTLAELANILDVCAAQPSWHVAAELPARDVPALFEVLCPTSRGTPSYSRAVGGVAVECGEVDAIAPVGGTPDIIDNAFKRGRHVLLSLFTGTQRPHECSRVVTSQADVVVAFSQHEPRDIEYLSRAISKPVGNLIRHLPKYHHVWYDQATGMVYVRDEHRVTYRTLNPYGEDV